jgi:hypothetical protein
MSNPFFDHPILNSPYEYPRRHWELDDAGQPTQKIIEHRRSAKFITPIPKPKKRKAAAQTGFVFDEGKGLSTKEQQYDPTSIINEVRGYVDAWRQLSPSQWQVTPETARSFATLASGQVQQRASVLLPGGGGGNSGLLCLEEFLILEIFGPSGSVQAG